MTARKDVAADHARGFTWRGLRFSPPLPTEGDEGFYTTEPITLGDDARTAEWKVRRTRSAWHARLRIGADRYPGVGATREQALAAAEAEAVNVATLIVAMLPEASSPAARKKRPRVKRKG